MGTGIPEVNSTNESYQLTPRFLCRFVKSIKSMVLSKELLG